MLETIGPAYRTGLMTANELTSLEILLALHNGLRAVELEILRTGGFVGPIREAQRKLSARLDHFRINLELALEAFGLHDE